MLSALPALVTIIDSDKPSFSGTKHHTNKVAVMADTDIPSQSQQHAGWSPRSISPKITYSQFRAYVDRSLQTIGAKRILEEADYQYLAARAGFVTTQVEGDEDELPTAAEYQEFKAWFARQLVLIKHCRKRFECMEPLTICGFWVTREVVEQELQSKPEGTFLLRFGSSAGALVVSIRGRSNVQHYELRTNDIQSSGLEAVVARVQDAKQLLDLRTGKRWPRSKVLDRSYFKAVEEAAARKRLRQERLASEEDILGDFLDVLDVSITSSTRAASEASANSPSVNPRVPAAAHPLQPGLAGSPYLQHWGQAVGPGLAFGGVGGNIGEFADYGGAGLRGGARGVQQPALHFAMPLATPQQPVLPSVNLTSGAPAVVSPFQPNFQHAAPQDPRADVAAEAPLSHTARFQACLGFLLPPHDASGTTAQLAQQQQQQLSDPEQLGLGALEPLGFQHPASVPAVHTPQLQGSQHLTEFSPIHVRKSTANQQQLAEQMDLLQMQLMALRAQGKDAELQDRLAAWQQQQQQPQEQLQQQQQQRSPFPPIAWQAGRHSSSLELGSGGTVGLQAGSSTSLSNIMRLSGGPSLSSLMRLANTRQAAQTQTAEKPSPHAN